VVEEAVYLELVTAAVGGTVSLVLGSEVFGVELDDVGGVLPTITLEIIIILS
jgi:hypothetical protein